MYDEVPINEKIEEVTNMMAGDRAGVENEEVSEENDDDDDDADDDADDDEEDEEEEDEEVEEKEEVESEESIEYSDFDMFDEDDYDDFVTSDEEISENEEFDEFSNLNKNEQVSDENDETIDKSEMINIEMEFSKAIDSKNNCLINSLILKEGILEQKFSSNKTFLHIATERGTVENVVQICKLDANINAVNNKGETPIFHAAAKNTTEIVKVLIDHGANVTTTSKKNVNPLHLALLHGSVETIRLILNRALSEIDENFKSKTKNNCHDISKNTSTGENSKLEKSEMVELVENLLKHRSDLNLHANDYSLLIFFAAKTGDYEILELILRDCQQLLHWIPPKDQNIENPEENRSHCKNCGCTVKSLSLPPHDLNFQGHFNLTALHFAVREQLSHVVRFLLQQGADPNSPSLHSWGPLHYAVFLGNEEICQMLLDYGAFANCGNVMQLACGKISALTCYYSTGYAHDDFPFTGPRNNFHPRIMELLLRKGANVDRRFFCDNGKTALHEACRAGQLDVVEILLKSGADHQAVDDDYNSALHYAAIGNSVKIVKALLDLGHHIDVINSEGYTPLMFVIKYGEKKLSTLSFTTDKYSNMSENVEMVEYLICRGASLNARNDAGGSALHVAVDQNLPDLVLTLLELGADEILKEFTDSQHRCMVCIHTFPDFPKIGRNVLIAHIALKEYDLLGCVEKCFSNQEQTTKIVEIYNQCVSEREKLKSTVILQNQLVTYHDFLTLDLVSAAEIAIKSKMRNKLLDAASCQRTEFPCYGYFFGRRLKRIEDFKVRAKPIKNFLLNYGKHQLPLEIIEMIINYLRWEDVKIFSRILLNYL